MSSQTDRDALLTKIALLESQSQIKEERSAKKIEGLEAKNRELEDEVVTLELHKRLSLSDPRAQASLTTASAGSSNAALHAEISKLKDEVADKDAIIARQDEKISRLRRLGMLIRDEFEADDQPTWYEPRRSLTSNVSVYDTEGSGEPSSTFRDYAYFPEGGSAEDTAFMIDMPSPKSAPTGLSRNISPYEPERTPSRPPPTSLDLASSQASLASTLMRTEAESTPASFAKETAPATVAPPKMLYTQVLQTPREKEATKKGRANYAKALAAHAQLAAREEAEIPVRSGSENQETPQGPKKVHEQGRGEPRGRGGSKGRGGSTWHQRGSGGRDQGPQKG